jgi:anti-sigma B factor antagonist
VKIDLDEKRAGVYVVALQGDMDMSTSPEVRKTMAPLWRKGTVHVIVDLSGVSYIDSSGIATFVEGLQLSQKGAIRLTLAGMSAGVEAVFELAYLHEVFEVLPRVELALQAGAAA